MWLNNTQEYLKQEGYLEQQRNMEKEGQIKTIVKMALETTKHLKIAFVA